MPDAAATVPLETTLRVRDTCLCVHVQRAARTLAARFDEALRPAGLTNTQFSLLNALNGREPKALGAVAGLVGADRTTITATLKPLVRQGLARVGPDPKDRRIRRIALTEQGHARLALALPLWGRAHDALEADLDGAHLPRMRRDLDALSASRRHALGAGADGSCAPRSRNS